MYNDSNKLARAVILFIEAVLGFEQDTIRLAVDALYEAEQASSRDRTRNQRVGIPTSSKYPPGTEYALTSAESHLMGAITLLLTESMLDSAKALFKLRKAYQILDELNRLVNEPKCTTLKSSASMATLVSAAPMKSVESNFDPAGFERKMHAKLSKFKDERAKRVNFDPTESSETLVSHSQDTDDVDAVYMTVDEFIESGVNCMFGLIQLVISIIPPTIGKVLSVVGFRGSKEEGLEKLWAAVDCPNVHGAIALLALLQYYDGPTQVSDITLPDEGESSDSGSSVFATAGTPTGTSGTTNFHKQQEEVQKAKHKLKISLQTIKQRYARGALWQLQEGRMVGATGDLERSVAIMDDTSNGPIEMKQVEGLMLYDKTMSMVVLHRFEESAENFIRLIDLNTWSHALYMYLAGSCYVEIYRLNKESDPAKAAEAKKRATECIEKAPTMLGKRKVMARAMPFDIFVQRKVKLWKQVASQKKLDLVDAIGTSPIFEVVFIWNGFAKMSEDKLDIALKSIGYSGKPGSPYAASSAPPLEEIEDEFICRTLLQTVTLRCLGRLDDAVELLEKHTLPKVWTPTPAKGTSKSGLPKVQYHKHLREPWVGPSAIYERGLLEWKLHGMDQLERARDYMDFAIHWDEDYELSTRVVFKIKSAKDKLEALEG